MPASSALELPIAEAVHAAASGIERRIHQRLRPEEVQWLRQVRLKNGPEVSLVDISSGGALVESREEMPVGAQIQLDFAAGGLIDAEVRWSKGTQFGCQFREKFNLKLLQAAQPATKAPTVMAPNYLTASGSDGK